MLRLLNGRSKYATDFMKVVVSLPYLCLYHTYINNVDLYSVVELDFSKDEGATVFSRVLTELLQ